MNKFLDKKIFFKFLFVFFLVLITGILMWRYINKYLYKPKATNTCRPDGYGGCIGSCSIGTCSLLFDVCTCMVTSTPTPTNTRTSTPQPQPTNTPIPQTRPTNTPTPQPQPINTPTPRFQTPGCPYNCRMHFCNSNEDQVSYFCYDIDMVCCRPKPQTTPILIPTFQTQPTNTPTPTLTSTITWNITTKPVCPTGMILNRPLRMFRIIWPQAGQPGGGWDCVNDQPTTSNHSMVISPKNITEYQGIYVGLEDPIRNGQEANCSEGVAIEPISINPSVTVIRQGSNPQTGDFVNFNKYMNPYNWMVHWYWNRLGSGSYEISFNVPNEWCAFPCSKKSQGDANCDEKIDGIDYSMWLNRQCNSGCAAENLKADFNLDNKVNDDDYSIWFNNRQ